MKIKTIICNLVLCLLCIIKANAQDVLTLENAVKIALENNFEIKISRNELKIDQVNVAYGNAGMLPRVAANFQDNNNIQNTTQTRIDGTTNKLNNAKNNLLTYGVGLNWTIFDGFRMFARYDQLKTLQKQGEAELKLTIITRISDVHSNYYDLVQQQQQLIALDSSIVISNQRLELAKNRYNIGRAHAARLH